MSGGASQRLARALLVPVLRVVGALAFDARYLRGRHFDEALSGWYWLAQALWFQKVLGFNRGVPWPVSPHVHISKPENLVFHPDDLHNFQSFGIYFQNFAAPIRIGRGTFIGPNVGLITANHDPADPSRHLPGAEVVLGERCWIGMNAVLLPGVRLGDCTTVAAGSVVTESRPEGYCILAGAPARVVRTLDRPTGGEGG